MISLKVVTNTSPLIHLAILNRFQLLRELFDEVSLPEAVYHEVAVHESGQPAVKRGISTIHTDLVIKRIGRLSTKDAASLQNALSGWLRL